MISTNTDEHEWGRLSNDRWVVFELLQKTQNSEIELVQRKIPSEAIALDRSNACQPSFIDEVLGLYKGKFSKKKASSTREKDKGNYNILF